jgi:hypothetical protein
MSIKAIWARVAVMKSGKGYHHTLGLVKTMLKWLNQFQRSSGWGST